MKIVFICDFNPFTQSSAISNRYEGLLRGLANDGVEIQMIIRNFTERDSLCNLPSKITCSYLSHTCFRKKNKFEILNEMLFGDCLDKSQRIVLARVLEKVYDFIWIAGGNAIRRTVFDLLDTIKSKLYIEFSEYQQLYKQQDMFFLRKWQYYREFKTTCKLIPHIHYIGLMTKTLIPYYKQYSSSDTKFLHLPMTVDLNRFAHNHIPVNNASPYIAFVGTYTNIKDGVLILVKSFSRICHKYPNVKLRLAGFDHPDRKVQMNYIKQNHLDKQIEYLGLIEKDQIPDFINNASLLVLSRPDSHQAQGGFPTKLGEYLATGNPVCVTKVGEIPEYLEDNVSAFMATPGDVDSFADAMDRALSNLEQAKKVGQKGREVAEKEFNSETQARRLHEFWAENV